MVKSVLLFTMTITGPEGRLKTTFCSYGIFLHVRLYLK
jgi:hypothetical protein